MSNRFSVAGIGCAALWLAGCAVGPDYVRPTMEAPAAFKENADWKPAQPADDTDKGAWWQIYADPQLDQLLQQVESSNQNVRAAEARYRQALALVQSARSQLFPTLSANVSGTRSGAATRNNSTQLTTAQSGNTSSYSAAVDATWEADLWGRVRRDIESNNASAASSAATLINTRLSAQALLAQNYFQLRTLDAQRQLYDDTVAGYQKALELANNRYVQGVAAKSDVRQAETQLKTAQSQGVGLGVQRAQLEHAIALLIGKSASEFSITPAPLPMTTPAPVVPAGLPSSLLERRPDVAAAERLVASANAKVGVAQAAFFPALTLSGTTGFQGANFANLLAAPNHFWSFGPALALTLLDFGARDAQKAQAIAAYDEAVANYRQAVLTAFQEVEDNLAALRILEEQAQLQEEAVKAAQESAALVLNQYKAGTVSYSDVVTAQATALSNQRSALDILNSRMAASVLLIKALGGGWSVVPDAASSGAQ
jgi:NodT family efflux transporter outer membrane factor (OMF) lipoprotein